MLNKLFYLRKRALWLLIAILLPSFLSVPTISADKPRPQVPTQEMVITATPVDPRAAVLHDYLAQYNSPLANNSQDFINAADEYGIDWKLVAAISGVESTFGKQIPGGFNGWGWGVYGDQALAFTSWKDGIYTVSKGLKENYISKGLTDPYSMNRVYAASPAWGGHVAYFLNDLDKYAKAHMAEKQPLNVGLSAYSSTAKDSHPSAQLAKTSSLTLNLVALKP